MSKHKGVKKGSPQALSYAARKRMEEEVNKCHLKFGGQIEVMDIMCVALIRMRKSHREKFFAELNQYMEEAMKEFRSLVKQADREKIGKIDITDLKVKLDRELAIGLGNNWTGFEHRWNPDRHTWGLPSFPPAYDNGWTPEDEEALRKQAAWTLEVGAVKQGDLPQQTEKRQYTAEQAAALNEWIAEQFK